jgi:hypothetical protein
MTLLKAYLHHVYYRPCGITHMMPDLDDMDYTGDYLSVTLPRLGSCSGVNVSLRLSDYHQ